VATFDLLNDGVLAGRSTDEVAEGSVGDDISDEGELLLAPPKKFFSLPAFGTDSVRQHLGDMKARDAYRSSFHLQALQTSVFHPKRIPRLLSRYRFRPAIP
jgi:hypothetical protein